jgi:hypothetical protein
MFWGIAGGWNTKYLIMSIVGSYKRIPPVINRMGDVFKAELISIIIEPQVKCIDPLPLQNFMYHSNTSKYLNEYFSEPQDFLNFSIVRKPSAAGEDFLASIDNTSMSLELDFLNPQDEVYIN